MRDVRPEIFLVSPRAFKIIVAFAAAALLAFVGAVIFLGYSSASGSPILEYRGKAVSTQQYNSDVSAVVDYLTNLGFKKVTETEMPASTERKAADSRYEFIHSFEYPVVFSRPISLRLYSDRRHEGVLVVFYARNPTWAVPFQKNALRKFAVIPLVSFWRQLTQKEDA